MEGLLRYESGLAASIIAVESYLELNPNFTGSIELSGTADEETGGYGGVGYLAEKGILAKPRIDHVIIPEPLNKDRICLGHRGVWWAEIETLGRSPMAPCPLMATARSDTCTRYWIVSKRTVPDPKKQKDRHASSPRWCEGINTQHQFHSWRRKRGVRWITLSSSGGLLQNHNRSTIFDRRETRGRQTRGLLDT